MKVEIYKSTCPDMAHDRVPEEELPGHIPGVGEASLSDLCADGVYDGGGLLQGKEVRDVAHQDELWQVYQEVLLHHLLLFQQEQHFLTLRTGIVGYIWITGC